MENTNVLKGELAGAGALNAINDNINMANTQPLQIHRLGTNLLSRLLHNLNNRTLKNKYFVWSIAGDLLGNVLYSALMANAKKGFWWRGSMLGFLTGLGGLLLPPRVGIKVDVDRNTRTLQNKLITIGWYLIGGMAASAVVRMLHKTSDSNATSE